MSLLRIIICFILLLLSTYTQAEEVIKCEIIETSPVYKCDILELNGIKWLLIHHLYKKDRPLLSKWLKNNSGKQVTFIINKKKVDGVLFRLSNCFGRGLLIYKAEIKPRKHDIIKLLLP